MASLWYLLLLLGIPCLTVAHHHFAKFIVGGNEAGKAISAGIHRQTYVTTTEFPYVATLEQFGIYQGGAAIVSPVFVLTAAHCVKGKSAITLKVRAGTFSRESSKISKFVQVRMVSSILVHEEYRQKVKLPDYDIALLKLRKPFELTNHVNIVKWATKGRRYAGMQGVILGHGQTEKEIVSKNLMQAKVTVLTDEDCRKKSPVRLGTSMICSIGHPHQAVPCIGDSGGPFVVKHNAANPTSDVLIGIASLIIERKDSRYGTTCDPTLPGIFANVGDHQEWIDKHTKKK